MFTDDSILLRDYFFPRITLKNSIEFKELYDHFQSIQVLPVQVTNFIDKVLFRSKRLFYIIKRLFILTVSCFNIIFKNQVFALQCEN